MIQKLVNEIFSTGQMKNPFADFEICSAHSAAGDALKTEKFTRRINLHLFSIIYSMIELDHYEKEVAQMYANDLSNQSYAVQMHHKNVVNSFDSIMRYSLLLFEKCTQSQVINPAGIKSLLDSVYPLSADENKYLSAEWWDPLALSAKAMNEDGDIKCFIEDSTLMFQVAGDERSWLMNGRPTGYLKARIAGMFGLDYVSVNSLPYFSLCFLGLIKYLEVLSRYCCIHHYSRTHYESCLAQHTGEDAYKTLEIEPAENTLAFIQILSGVPRISDSCFTIAEFSL